MKARADGLTAADQTALALGRLVLNATVATLADSHHKRNFRTREDAEDHAFLWMTFAFRDDDRARAEVLLRRYLATLPVFRRPWPCIRSERRRRAKPVTITPEDTLREAGIDDGRQAAYQRKMSTLLGGRGADGR